jgi:5-methylcytosine-specific restriction endonuclease McrA
MIRHRLSPRERERVFDDNRGVCHICEQLIQRGQAWQVSHPIPLANGGEDVPSNRKPAHTRCHEVQTAKVDLPAIAKSIRQRQKDKGIRPEPRRVMPGSRASGWKHRLGHYGREAWVPRQPSPEITA